VFEKRFVRLTALLSLLSVAMLACTGEAAQPSQPTSTVLKIAGIPEQNASTLVRRYEGLETYLSEQLGVEVEYVPTVDYSATVAAFRNGDVHLAFFGGLTGVQAREAVPGSVAIAHRPRDAEFHSKFIAAADLDVSSLEDVRGKTLTFGSESSTSGHLMPRHYMIEAGIDPDADLSGPPSYSGSHDTTWKLVESGTYQIGALDEAVWQRATTNGEVDQTKVKEFYTTPAYYDYNWTARGDLDTEFGEGFTERAKQALLAMNTESNGDILELFSTDSFVATQNSNYDAIKAVAEQLGVIQ
jgi:phosphonate transport system substrate-binding protein